MRCLDNETQKRIYVLRPFVKDCAWIFARNKRYNPCWSVNTRIDRFGCHQVRQELFRLLETKYNTVNKQIEHIQFMDKLLGLGDREAE